MEAYEQRDNGVFLNISHEILIKRQIEVLFMHEQYDLEIDTIVSKIEAEKAKIVCIQLPEGLRPYAREIVQQIEMKTNAKVIIWLGSCWGACDVPLEVNRLGVDLLVQWGHSEWGH